MKKINILMVGVSVKTALLTVFLMAIIVMTTTYSIAQTPKYNLQFVEVANDGINGGDFDVLIQIRAEDASFELGNSNLSFNFNNFGIINPVLLSAHNFNTGDYSYMSEGMTLTEPIGENEGIISLNINYIESSGSGDLIGTSNWVDVATVRFEIIDFNQFSGFTWRSSNDEQAPTVVSEDNNDLQIAEGSTITNLNTPLPVELISFTAKAVGNSAILNWSTASELNNMGFFIERSNNNGIWETVGFVDGNGNASNINEYEFTDHDVLNSTGLISEYYYRLKQMDYNGNFEYSVIRRVIFESKGLDSDISVNIYPNPASDVLNVSVYNNVSETEGLNLKFYSLEGKIVNELDLNSFYSTIDISYMKNGIYQLIITNESNIILYNTRILINN